MNNKYISINDTRQQNQIRFDYPILPMKNAMVNFTCQLG